MDFGCGHSTDFPDTSRATRVEEANSRDRRPRLSDGSTNRRAICFEKTLATEEDGRGRHVPTLELTFEGCIQDSEEYGSGPDRMVSRVFFWIRREGGPPGDYRADLDRATGNLFAKRRLDPPERYNGPMLHAEIVQPVGQDFQTGRIDVSAPVGYSGPFDQSAFARSAAEYFRTIMSDSGVMQRNEEGRPLRGGYRATEHVRLRHNAELSRRTVRLALPAATA